MRNNKHSDIDAMDITGRSTAPRILIPFILAALVALHWLRAFLRR